MGEIGLGNGLRREFGSVFFGGESQRWHEYLSGKIKLLLISQSSFLRFAFSILFFRFCFYSFSLFFLGFFFLFLILKI